MGLRAEKTKVLREWSLGSLVIKKAGLTPQKFLALPFSQGCTTQERQWKRTKILGQLSEEQGTYTNSQQYGVGSRLFWRFWLK